MHLGSPHGKIGAICIQFKQKQSLNYIYNNIKLDFMKQ